MTLIIEVAMTAPSLSALLRKPHSPVGQAFKRLYSAGCDSDWLETMLVALNRFPPGRARQGFTTAHKRQFEAVIADLDSAAGQLERTLDFGGFLLPVDWGVLFHGSLAPDGNDQTISLDDLPDLLRAISKFLS